MSEGELRRGELPSRVKRGEMKLGEAAERLELSYRQTKRLYKRYGESGAAALKHGNAGRRPNRPKSKELREKALQLAGEPYGGGEPDGFGPTLAAEHGIEVDHETLCSPAGCGGGTVNASRTASVAKPRRTSASCCNLTAAIIVGSKSAARKAA